MLQDPSLETNLLTQFRLSLNPYLPNYCVSVQYQKHCQRHKMTSPHDPQPKTYSHLNGTQQELLDRFAVSEVCKGWPVYRDSSEWVNYRSMFTADARIWTSTTSFLTLKQFLL